MACWVNNWFAHLWYHMLCIPWDLGVHDQEGHAFSFIEVGSIQVLQYFTVSGGGSPVHWGPTEPGLLLRAGV